MENYDNDYQTTPMDLSRTMRQNGILPPFRPAHSLQQAGFVGCGVRFRPANGLATGSQTGLLNLPSTSKQAIVQKYLHEPEKPRKPPKLAVRIKKTKWQLEILEKSFLNNPYLTGETCAELVRSTGLDWYRVTNWFIYWRGRAKIALNKKEKQQNPETLDTPKARAQKAQTTRKQRRTATQSTNHNVLYPPPYPFFVFNQQAPAPLIDYCRERHLTEHLAQSYGNSYTMSPVYPMTGGIPVVNDYYNFNRPRTYYTNFD